MTQEDRKAALARYRERKVAAGIYAVRCTASGERWVGRAPDLSTIRNRIWFTLRHGSHAQPALQAAWNVHGAEALDFEIVEALKPPEPDESAYLRDRQLKARLEHWRQTLGAGLL
jgi:hypothetical protein